MEKRVKQGSIRTRFTRSIFLILGISYVLTLAVLLSFVRAYFYTNFYNTAQSQVAFSADFYRDNLATAGTLIEALYADRRGDILLAQGKIEEARAAWQRALESFGAEPIAQIVQLKIDAIAGA